MTPDKTEFGENRPDLETVKKMRREHPSGWLELSMDPARALLIDAILDSPDNYEFSPPEIAPRAGITPQSVRNHIGILVERGILEKIEDSRYRINEEGKVTGELNKLNSAVTAVRSGGAKSKNRDVNPDDRVDNSQHDTDQSTRFNSPPGAPINAD